MTPHFNLFFEPDGCTLDPKLLKKLQV